MTPFLAAVASLDSFSTPGRGEAVCRVVCRYEAGKVACTWSSD